MAARQGRARDSAGGRWIFDGLTGEVVHERHDLGLEVRREPDSPAP